RARAGPCICGDRVHVTRARPTATGLERLSGGSDTRADGEGKDAHVTYTAPYLGFGLGLRMEHCAEILAGEPAIDWFEAQTETYLVPGGKPLHDLMSVRARFPVALHGVSLSVGSTAPLDL